MTDEQLCEQYIDLIKQHECYDKAMLNRLLTKHDHVPGYECMNDLSILWDYLEENNGLDERLELKFQSEYGWNKEYNEQQDQEWTELTKYLEEVGEI